MFGELIFPGVYCGADVLCTAVWYHVTSVVEVAEVVDDL